MSAVGAINAAIYLDTSAVLKRAFDEVHSLALHEQLQKAVADGRPLVTSALTRVEVGRALRRRIDSTEPRQLSLAFEEVFADISVAPILDSIVEHARIIGPPLLRSLDAIHLATAVALGADEVWTYDERMATVADGLGILSRTPA